MTLGYLSPGARTQILTPALLLILFVVLVNGFSSIFVAWLPLTPSEAVWRFRSMVQLFGIAPQVAFLLTAIVYIAMQGGQYGVVRGTAIFTMFFGVVLLGLLPFFGLDFIAARRLQVQSDLAAYTREGMRVAAMTGVLGLVFIWAGWKAFTGSKVDKTIEKEVGHGLVVGQAEQPM